MGETVMSNHGQRAPVPTLRDPTPSVEDVRLTAEAGRAGRLLGIEVLDYVVIARHGHVSLREQGLYRPDDVASPSGSQSDLPGNTSRNGATDA